MSKFGKYLWKILILICLLGMGTLDMQAGKDKDVAYLREKITEQLLDVPISDKQIRTIVETVRPDGTWSGIDYVDVSRTAFQHVRHLNNLVQLAIAYQQKGSPWKGNKSVKQAFDKGLAYWLAHDFQCENWWNNEIGTPTSFITMLLVMDKHLTKGQIEGMLPIVRRANLNASGARPSGDRIKIAGLQAKTALFCWDAAQVSDVMQVIEGEIKIVEPGKRGIQADYSFHHRPDRVNNTLSYGLDYIHVFAEWADLVSSTRFCFSETSLRMAVDYYLDGVCKQMVYGRTEDTGIRNRDITRVQRKGYFSTQTPERLLAITDYRKDELQQVVKARKGEEFQAASFAKFFWQTEHFVFQRPSYYTSVRMYSTRNRNMEEPYNGEGVKNHFRADGTNYLSVSGDEYFNLSPVYDWCCIPGTTTCLLDKMPPADEIQKEGLTDFVGGVTDGMYGTAAFDFISPRQPLKARKSWFFFDREYVCLGAGIQSSSPDAVVTTLNQNHLEGPVIVEGKEGRSVLPAGNHVLKDTKWVWHNQTGYIFPDKTTLELMNQEAAGTWFSVSNRTDASKDTIREPVFKLRINHGIRPTQSSYSYIVLPQTDEAALAAYQKDPQIRIISNTTDLQAVEQPATGLVYLVCYRAVEQKLDQNRGVLRVDSPALLMARYHSNGRLRSLTVADPSRKLSHLHVSFSGKYETGNTSTQIRSSYDTALQETFLSIALPQGAYAGSSVSVSFDE